MHWLLIGYMFLFIDRPFEVWPWLGDLRIERIYMCLTLAVWAVYPHKRFLPNLQHAAYAALATAVLAAWVMSPWMERTQPIIEDWFKIIVFYGLLVTTVHDEKALKRIVLGFVGVMAMYLTHSLKEYIAGRHTYRMGIARMIGVDTTLGDPNSFGASIIYVLPFVAAIWRTGWGGGWGRLALLGYTGLSTLCILLTGSRGSLVGLLVWFFILAMGHRKRFLWIALFVCGAPAVFVALPPSLQNRFETIVNPEAGPANAKESGEGRIEGLLNGLTLWSRNPISGVGPGAWRPATGSNIESHNLYGQILGETGTLGAMAFMGMIGCFVMNLMWVRKVRQAYPEWSHDFTFQVPSAVATSLFLLLFMGNFGHNLFRFSWLWYGGFLIISRYCIEQRLAEAWYAAEQPGEEVADELNGDWIPHAGHV